MIGFARFAMKSRLNAGALAAGLAALPMLYAISAALVALVTLRRGSTEGTRVLMFSLAGALVAWQLTGLVLPLLVLPITALLAMVLRQTQDWSQLLVFAAVLGLFVAFGADRVMGDRLAVVIGQVQAVMTGNDSSNPVWRMFEAVKPDAAYLVTAAEMFEALLCLVLARYWQAGLYNPGGLRTEFHELRISGRPLLVLVGLLIVAFLVKPAAMLLLLLPLFFAGAALVHGMVAKAKLGGQWLVAFYLGAVLFNQFMLPLLVLVAVADGVVDLRSRLAKRPDQDDE